MKKILITGWLGYIGSHVSVVFQQAWYEVVILDNCSNSTPDVLDRIEATTGTKPVFYSADMRVIAEIEPLFRDHKDIDGVIHLAAKKLVSESCKQPFKYYSNNVKGTLHLFQTMEKYAVRNCVFASSASVYDTQKNIPPYVESDLVQSNDPYGSTKIIGEQLLKDLAQFKQFSALSLRCFNAIWAHHSWNLGDQPKSGAAGLLPSIFKVVSQKVDKFKMFWKDFDTKDGSGVRDYVHVMDIAQAFLVAYERLPDLKTDQMNWYYDVMNIGSWEGTSVMEIVELVEKVTGKNVYYEVAKRRQGDPASTIANASKATKVLWREPTRSLRQAVQDYQAFTDSNQ